MSLEAGRTPGLPDPVIAAAVRIRPLVERAAGPVDTLVARLDDARIENARLDLERRAAWALAALVAFDLAVERRDAAKGAA